MLNVEVNARISMAQVTSLFDFIELQLELGLLEQLSIAFNMLNHELPARPVIIFFTF